MASGHEVQLKLTSARDLKNVNWRNGALKPYAVVWVDPNNKSSTRVDEEGDTSPYWDETLTIHLPGPVDGDATLHIDIVHAGSDPDTKPLIGSARLKLRDVIDDVGFDEPASRTLQLKRPSGRPQGKVDVKVTIRDPRYRAPDPYNAPPYGVPPPAGSRDYTAPPTAYGAPYGVPAPPPPQNPYNAAPPPSGYPYNQYSVAPAPPYGQMGQGSYGRPGQGYEQGAYGKEEKKSKFGGMGMGTGLAVGAVAGAVGGVALAEGFDYVEDKIADDVAEKVEDDVYDGDDGDDFYVVLLFSDVSRVSFRLDS